MPIRTTCSDVLIATENSGKKLPHFLDQIAFKLIVIDLPCIRARSAVQGCICLRSWTDNSTQRNGVECLHAMCMVFFWGTVRDSTTVSDSENGWSFGVLRLMMTCLTWNKTRTFNNRHYVHFGIFFCQSSLTLFYALLSRQLFKIHYALMQLHS